MHRLHLVLRLARRGLLLPVCDNICFFGQVTYLNRQARHHTQQIIQLSLQRAWLGQPSIQVMP
jgi:hypothetical protein